jgi:hypothetical protein
MRVAAAPRPMNSAKKGSATREIRYVGGGIMMIVIAAGLD